MDPMVIAYNDDVHSGNGKTGIKARCVDCHIPHDNIAKYALTKAKNGILEAGCISLAILMLLTGTKTSKTASISSLTTAAQAATQT